MAMLNNRKIAILAENGFEESELFSPKKALEQAGATVHVISPQKEKIRAMKDHQWSAECTVDRDIADVHADEYDGLMLPGGVFNPDKLRTNSNAISFIQEFFRSGKPVAAICHGPQTLISAQVVNGRKMTSYPSIKQDMINAGVNWVDEEVVVDQGLVTSRSPEDLPAFNAKMVEEFAEGVHAGQHS
jgi:protease I